MTKLQNQLVFLQQLHYTFLTYFRCFCKIIFFPFLIVHLKLLQKSMFETNEKLKNASLNLINKFSMNHLQLLTPPWWITPLIYYFLHLCFKIISHLHLKLFKTFFQSEKLSSKSKTKAFSHQRDVWYPASATPPWKLFIIFYNKKHSLFFNISNSWFL